MRTLLDIMFMFRGAYLALLIMGVYQYCIHVPPFRQSGVKEYHKSTFVVGLLMGWVAGIEIYWYIIEFLGLNCEHYYQDIYSLMATMIPTFLYLTSHTIRYDDYFTKKIIVLNFLPILIPILYILFEWKALVWIGIGYSGVFFVFAYMRHNWWYRAHKKLLHETYSDPYEHSTRWFNIVMIILLIQSIIWILARVSGEPMVSLLYYAVSIIVYFVFVYQSSRQSDHTVILNDIKQREVNAKSGQENILKISVETIATIDKQLARTEKEQLYLKHDIDVSEYCKQIGTNHSYFSRYLNQEKGMTFYQYINSMRMTHVQEKLINTDLSMEEIAFECGYNDSRSFRRAFKENFNITPTEYREKYR